MVTGAFFGFCYVSVLMSYVYLTRAHSDGVYFVWLILLSAWGSDTLAYCTGMLIGRHKLCPSLSPKKTIEGAIGGVIGSALLSAIFGALFAKQYLIHFVIIGVLASPVSMLGDLTASAYKRHMGIKDYGNLIPGHGGIMDRFDSVLFTAPFVYYYVVIVMQYYELALK